MRVALPLEFNTVFNTIPTWKRDARRASIEFNIIFNTIVKFNIVFNMFVGIQYCILYHLWKRDARRASINIRILTHSTNRF